MTMDPCHRLVLEKFIHLIEDAGYTLDQIRGTRTACYIGQYSNDHLLTVSRQKAEAQRRFMGPNMGLFNASSRLAYHFDLHGPNVSLDTACSTSLQAVHLAIQALRNNEAEMAVAGGANTNYSPENFMNSTFVGALSHDGISHSFSADANGFAKGEGIGLILLKKLNAAIADNDHIHCVIRDVLANHDGNQLKTGYTVPSTFGQHLLLSQIYSRNKIDLKEVFYVEAHGTGTQVGDPVEANTLENGSDIPLKLPTYDPIKQHFILILSTKCEQSMKNQMEKFYSWFSTLPKELLDTQEQIFLAHLCRIMLLKRTTSFPYRLSFAFSNSEQFKKQMESYLANNDCSGVIVPKQTAQRLSQPFVNICFVYSGQGPQWWAMGRELYCTEPIFRQWIDKIDTELKLLSDEWTLIDELITKDEHSSRIDDTNIAQPAIFAIQVALTALWLSWGIVPKVIVGHSVGEISAAFVGGRLPLKEAVKVIYYRSRLQHRNTRQGGRMLATSFSVPEAQKLIAGVKDRVAIAAVNSSQSVTLSGDGAVLEEIYDLITTLKPNLFKRWLRVENAFHSQQMEKYDIQKDLITYLADINGYVSNKEATVFDVACSNAVLYSTVSGSRTDKSTVVFNGDYWWENVRNTVQFNNAIESILRDFSCDPIQAFLEISPHPVLSTSLQEIFDENKLSTTPFICHSLKRKENEQQTILSSLGQLFLLFDVRRELVHLDHVIQGNIIFPAAGYIEMAIAAVNELSFLLSTQETIQQSTTSITFENIQFLNALVLKEDESVQINTVIKMPFREFSIYSRRHTSQDSIRSKGISGADIAVSFTDEKSLNTYSTNEWVLHATGLINMKTDVSLISSLYKPQTVLDRFRMDSSSLSLALDESKMNDFYTFISRRGFDYGPNFRNIKSLYGKVSEILAEIAIPSLHGPDEDLMQQYYFYPMLLDACFQALLSIIPENGTFVPVSIDKLFVCGGTNKSLIPTLNQTQNVFSYASFNSPLRGITAEEQFTSDLFIFNSSDCFTTEILMMFHGCKIQNIPGVSSSVTSIISPFQKLKENASINNRIKPAEINPLIERFCFKTYWKQSNVMFDSAWLLPDINTLFNANDNGSVQNMIQYGKTQADNEAEQVIDLINELSARYMLISVKQLLNIPSLDDYNVILTQSKLRSLVIPMYYKFLDELLDILQNKGFIERCADINGEHQWKFAATYAEQLSLINEHSNNMLLSQMLKQFPSIKSIPLLNHVCGSNLSQILTGKLDISQLLLGQGNDSLLKECCTLLDFANSTDTIIEYTFTDISPAFFSKAQQTFSRILEENNKKNLLQLNYQVFNFDSEPLLPLSVNQNTQNQSQAFQPESFDIIFASNAVHASSNVVIYLSNIRQLLAPVGIIILVEITSAEPFLDLIFGLLPQWWNTNPHDIARKMSKRAIITAEQWVNAFNLCQGFDEVQFVKGFVQSVIIARKSTSLSIINNLPERLQQAWVIFCDNKQEVGMKIADTLHRNYNGNSITLVVSNDTSAYSFNHVKVGTLTMFDDIKHIFQTALSQCHLLNIVFAWPLDLEPMKDNESERVVDENYFTFQHQEEMSCGTFMYIAQAIQAIRNETQLEISPNIFVLTQNGQSTINKSFNPTHSPLIGFARSLVNEYGMHRLKLIDIQGLDHLPMSNIVDKLVKEIDSSVTSSSLNENVQEIVLSFSSSDNDGNVFMQKWIPVYDKIKAETLDKNLAAVDNKFIIPNVDSDSIQFKLEIAPSRFLSDLNWVTCDDLIPFSLKPTEVVVKVHNVGINFRDVLKVRGLYPHIRQFGLDYQQQNANTRDEEFGSDFSGIVVRVGSDVTNLFRIGDKVFGLTSNTGVFKSHIVLNKNEIFPLPSNVTMEQACTVPTPFCTVLYGLRDRAHLKSGQSILIHAGSGAVGLAAIQYCRMIGNVTIICTAGTEEKRKFLKQECGIEHVFNSRDLSFATEVRRVVPNGVNVVLNSLANELLQESLKLLAPLGHFVEIGKRDVFANSKLPLFQLRADCTFHVVDLVMLQKIHPEQCYAFLQEISELCNRGALQPITPVSVFEPSQVKQAFALYNQVSHIGKLVVRLAGSSEQLELKERRLNTKNERKEQDNQMFTDLLCNKGTVLISGGLGGLGIEMSRWMIEEHGVKRIALMTRKNVNELDKDSVQFKEWINLKTIAANYSAHVEVVKADVTVHAQVLKVISEINRSEYPVRGIIHSAVVLHDTFVANMTQETLSMVMRPKIRGAWNLHYATIITSCPLHFFIMLSSLRNHIVNFGQSNYNAGNNFLDALAHYRLHCKHLPALSIDLCAVSGVGTVQRRGDTLMSMLRAEGLELIPTIYVFKIIEQLHLIQRQRQPEIAFSCPIMFTVNWRRVRATNNKLASLTKTVNEYALIEEQEEISKDEKTDFTMDIDTIKHKIHLAVSKLFGALSIDRIDLNTPLVQLVAVELLNWLEKEMRILIPVVELLQGITVTDLSLRVHSKLLSTHSGTVTVDNYNSVATNNEDNVENESQTEANNALAINDEYTGISLIEPLHFSDYKSTLFCVYDITGSSQIFSSFVDKMSMDQNSPSIVAFSASEYEKDKQLVTSIQTIAQEYITQMRRLQPRGPYHLIGYKFGCFIAYEMARQLHRFHQTTVKTMVLIDPDTSVLHEETLNYEVIHKLADKSREQSKTMPQVLPILEQYKHVWSADDNKEQTEHVKRITEISHSLYDAKEDYTMDVAADGSGDKIVDIALMFISSGGDENTKNHTIKNETQQDQTHIWKRILPQLTVRQVRCNHHSLLQAPFVDIIIEFPEYLSYKTVFSKENPVLTSYTSSSVLYN
ncbi:unnamed protein product [Didymodactylos carnosus]|uniref:Polyketide synthase n=1 Tax=Didymodactylos carnosus TaxID=1234261 RepID=A0A814L1I0_9BILA|nr:unnamed protein product [Didymodactylos carnosus]